MAKDVTQAEIDARNKPRTRGRLPKARVGEYMATIDAMQDAQDKVTVEDINEYLELNALMKDLSMARGKFAKAGVKDQVMAIRFRMERAEKYLKDHYAVMGSDEDGEEYEDEEQGAYNGASLIQLKAVEK